MTETRPITLQVSYYKGWGRKGSHNLSFHGLSAYGATIPEAKAEMVEIIGQAAEASYEQPRVFEANGRMAVVTRTIGGWAVQTFNLGNRDETQPERLRSGGTSVYGDYDGALRWGSDYVTSYGAEPYAVAV